jgi:hypothetical protein
VDERAYKNEKMSREAWMMGDLTEMVQKCDMKK